METQLLTLLAVIGFLCIAVAAFAVDWRAGTAFVGVTAVTVAVRLEAQRPPPERPAR